MQILDSLKNDGPQTVAELAEFLGATPAAVRQWIYRHRAAVRIADWRREPRHITAVWAVNCGQSDARKPRALTGNERAARYRAPRRALLSAKSSVGPASPWKGLR